MESTHNELSSLEADCRVWAGGAALEPCSQSPVSSVIGSSRTSLRVSVVYLATMTCWEACGQ